MAYTPTTWVDNVTPVDAVRMNHLEAGVDANDARLDTLEARPVTPAVVNGKWIKGVGAAMVWSDITTTDVGGLATALAAKQDTSAKDQASGYPSLDANGKVPVAELPPAAVATYGTSFPASPADKDEHVYVDSATNPTYQWRFRYNAGSSSAYKWEFIGGSPYYSDNNPNAAHRSLTQVAATGWYYHNTNYLTLPRAGDYWFVADAWFSHTVACQCSIGIFNGSTAPVGRSRRDTDTPSTGAERASSTSYKLIGAAASSLAGAAFSGSLDFTLKSHAVSCWPVRGVMR